MDRNRAWLTTALTGVFMLVIVFYTLGGYDGIARQPQVALITFAIMTAVAVPNMWFSYRRMRRYPTLVEVPPAAADFFGPDARLDNPPIILVASRGKLLGWALYIAVIGAVLLAIGFSQRGVCKVTSLAAFGPFFLLNFAAWIFCLFAPNRLTIAPQGLTHTLPWGIRHWTWDEIRNITLVKFQIPFARYVSQRRPSMSLYFKRYMPKGEAARGPARAGFRSVWRMSGDDLASLLEAARAKWSTPAGASFVPVPGTWRVYLRSALVLAISGGIMWMVYAHPCGPAIR